jgi:hypothetical protein
MNVSAGAKLLQIVSIQSVSPKKKSFRPNTKKFIQPNKTKCISQSNPSLHNFQKPALKLVRRILGLRSVDETTIKFPSQWIDSMKCL